ncbi:MAG: glycosyltransferase family 2 protein [Myxococcota bacterium]|nr:glycosyltransferase family 2 protein [Myxococcota bacterium]
MNPCLLIPVYNHGEPLKGVLAELDNFGLPCLLVDDGSDEKTKTTLKNLNERYSWVDLLTRPKNRGKGAALKDGYRRAHLLGFSHVVQLDADGQHDTSDIPQILKLIKAYPEAMVLIEPTFQNAPKLRRYGRLISYFWVWVECCSFAIRDPLCGYRGLPLKPLIAILDRVQCGNRMDFDPEIAVRLVWEGVSVINLPSTVLYPPEGISHFNQIWDNVLISWRHTRLVFGMILRLPYLLGRKVEIQQ